jgi:cytochrome P450
LLDEVVFGIIADRRRLLEAAPDDGPADLLTMLMTARVEDSGEGMSDRQLRDEVMTLLIAGHDSTSQALCWTFHLLATHPACEAEARAEVQAVLGDRPAGFADLGRLEYLTMCINEALRLYPTAWLMSRTPIKDDTIGGYQVRAGSVLLMSPFVTHRHPDVWPDPERFDPERFRPGRADDRTRYAFWPFGGGPRQCIGNQFSIFESLVVLSRVLQRFRMTVVPGQRIELEPMITIRPRYGIKVRLSPASAP